MSGAAQALWAVFKFIWEHTDELAVAEELFERLAVKRENPEAVLADMADKLRVSGMDLDIARAEAALATTSLGILESEAAMRTVMAATVDAEGLAVAAGISERAAAELLSRYEIVPKLEPPA